MLTRDLSNNNFMDETMIYSSILVIHNDVVAFNAPKLCFANSIYQLIIALTLIAFILSPSITVFSSNYTNKSLILVYYYVDDFNYSSDLEASKHWIIYRKNNDMRNEVVWDKQYSMVRLTTKSSNRAGAIFLRNVDLRKFIKWELNAIIFIGDDNGADGLAIAFFTKPGIGPIGGGLGWNGTGYAVEFDTYCNENAHDPRTPHIALIYRNVNYHLIVFKEGFPRARWLYVKLVFKVEKFISNEYVEGNLTILIWDGVEGHVPKGSIVVKSTLTQVFKVENGYLGFTAATGGKSAGHWITWMELKGWQYLNTTIHTVTVTVFKNTTATMYITTTVSLKETSTITTSTTITFINTVIKTLTITKVVEKTFTTTETVTVTSPTALPRVTETMTITSLMTSTITMTVPTTITVTVTESSGYGESPSLETMVLLVVVLVIGFVVAMVIARR